MKYEVKKDAVNAKELFYEGTLEQMIETEVNLPEYYCDVVKVLKCTVCPVVASTQISGNRVVIEGNAKFSFMFLGEDNQVYSYESSYPFSKSTEIKDLDEQDSVIAVARTDYVSCRASGKRQIAANATVSISIKVYRVKTLEIVTDCSIKGIQMKKKEISPYSFIKVEQKGFTVSDTCEIQNFSGTVKRIVKSDATAYLTDVKTINGKMMISGEMQVKSLAVTGGDEPDIIAVTSIIPFSQIFEISGVDENSICDVSVKVDHVDAQLQGSETSAAIVYNIKATALICIGEVKNIQAVSDAYSTAKATETKKLQGNLKVIKARTTEPYMFNSQVDVADLEIGKIIDISVVGLKKNLRTDGSKVYVYGSVEIGMLYAYNDGRISYAEKSVSFEYEKDTTLKAGAFECEANCECGGLSYSHASTDRLDIKAELKISLTVFEIESVDVLTDIEEKGDSEFKAKPASLVIYFSDPGETVWDIARKYNTTVEKIAVENNLTDDVIRERRMLLIPCV